jgi:hypothetical protein
MELLTNEGRNPVNDIESVIFSIRSLLVVGDGRLSAAESVRGEAQCNSKTLSKPDVLVPAAAAPGGAMREAIRKYASEVINMINPEHRHHEWKMLRGPHNNRVVAAAAAGKDNDNDTYMYEKEESSHHDENSKKRTFSKTLAVQALADMGHRG